MPKPIPYHRKPGRVARLAEAMENARRGTGNAFIAPDGVVWLKHGETLTDALLRTGFIPADCSQMEWLPTRIMRKH